MNRFKTKLGGKMKKQNVLITMLIMALTFSTSLMADGTEPIGDPREVSTLDHLLWISTNSSCWGDDFIQTADIDASATSGWNPTTSSGTYSSETTYSIDEIIDYGTNNYISLQFDNTGHTPGESGSEEWWEENNYNGFSPIGHWTTNFTGTYDGDGHKIDHLYINRPSSITYNQGLFGYVNGASISNIGLENIDVTGDSETGGLIGNAINDCTISYCYSNGVVNGFIHTGGLIGTTESKGNTLIISNCYSNCEVNSTDVAGGLIGALFGGDVSNCYATGTVTASEDYAGGFAGELDTNVLVHPITLNYCYSSGLVSAPNFIDGFAFHNTDGDPEVNNCFWDRETSGQSTSSIAAGKTTTQMKTQSTFTDWDFTDTWHIVSSEYWSYPYLQNNVQDPAPGYELLPPPRYSGGIGTETNPYQISTTVDLIELSNTSIDWEAYFIQTADLDFGDDETAVDWDGDGTANWDAEDQLGFSPIGILEFPDSSIPFTGSYDGGGHTIDYLYINRSTDPGIGLFGGMEGSVIQNLGITNANITGSVFVGSLIGYAYNCSSVGNYSTGSVSGSYYIGGLIGFTDLNEINNCYANCSVTGSSEVGGLIGLNIELTTVTNCYSHGDVTRMSGGTSTSFGSLIGSNGLEGDIVFAGGDISYCYAKGNVVYDGDDDPTDKGFVGASFASVEHTPVYTANFFDKEASNQSTDAVGAATGKTTSEMKIASTFTIAGWDFTDVWAINSGYPYLQWQNFSDFPAGEGTDLGDGTTVNPTTDLNYADDQTNIPEIPNGSFTPEHEFVLSGSGIVDIVITTSSQFGAYYQGGSWHTEENSGGTITFTGIDFDARGDIPIILGDDNPLLVTLSTFTAQFVNQELTIIWSTQSETNNSHWNIWRAVENTIENAERLNGENIGAAGNSNELIEYSYVDEKEVENHTTYYYWLESVDYSGQSNFYGSTSVTIELPDNPEAPEIPVVLGLHQNYPNPFNPDTKIRFAVKEEGNAEVTIFNMKGQKITTIFSGSVEANSYYEAIWNGRDDNAKDVASGVYFYQLDSSNRTEIKKMLLIK
jgi:hypothetical protein